MPSANKHTCANTQSTQSSPRKYCPIWELKLDSDQSPVESKVGLDAVLLPHSRKAAIRAGNGAEAWLLEMDSMAPQGALWGLSSLRVEHLPGTRPRGDSRTESSSFPQCFCTEHPSASCSTKAVLEEAKRFKMVKGASFNQKA